MSNALSIILPAKNESQGLSQLLEEIKSQFPEAELIVVNDGSTDNTEEIATRYATKVINHPYSLGNGAAIKSGARSATRENLVFMDADGQHKPSDIPKLLDLLNQGYEMAIGARGLESHASFPRRIANIIFNRFASLMTGVQILDLTSGFRAVNADKFKKFLYLLPNGFSYPTTITIAFLRTGYPISYTPIEALMRSGKSKISPLQDGIKFLMIILKVSSLFSPLRLFLPISLAVFFMGISYYAYTFVTIHRLTNMSTTLFISALLIFLIGIIAEQISSLHYQSIDQPNAPSTARTKNKKQRTTKSRS